MCSSHRSISFRESMPPPSDSAIHWPIRDRAHWFLFSSQELFFLVLLVVSRQRGELLASSPDRLLSHPLLRIPLGTLSLRNTLLLASHTEKPALRSVTRANLLQWHTHMHISYKLTDDTKRDTFTLLLFYTCFYNKPFVVVFSEEVSLFICIVK